MGKEMAKISPMRKRTRFTKEFKPEAVRLLKSGEKPATQLAAEPGLVLARQLLDIEDLHYGLWQHCLELELAKAQQRYETYHLLLYRLPCA